MRVIVPLQGLVQGKGGLVLGSVIPCVLFYFLQLYLKRNRSDPKPHPAPDSPALLSSGQVVEATGLHRSLSRGLLSPRATSGPAHVSSRANSIMKNSDSPYYVGMKKFAEDPYDGKVNPDGIIQLGLAENKLSLDLVRGRPFWEEVVVAAS